MIFESSICLLVYKFKNSHYKQIENIPLDYDGIIWVPITFLWKYNPEQFEIVGSNRWVEQDENWIYWRGSYLNGKETYKRIFIRKRNNDNESLNI